MNSNLEDNRTRIIKIVIFLISEMFALFSLIFFIREGISTRIIMSIITFALILLPVLAEYIIKKKLLLSFYILGILYSIGPLLGHSYNLYVILPWWDELLHFTGGLVFALFGFEIAKKLCKGRSSEVSIWLIAFFGLFFSMALSAMWEFAEYGADQFLGMDMQCDTVIHSITSYLLDPGQEVPRTIEDINEVIVNGQPLEIGGYLDIGLNDTMRDMLSESLGAVISTAIFTLSKGRFVIFCDKKKQE